MWPTRPLDGAARKALWATAILIALRFILGAWLPLSFDEAYYWLWSKHLALGYYDHPALIAFAIRAGTSIFGKTEFGVRLVPLAVSIAASWAVWRAAALWLASERAGAIACLLFSATLMVAAETMAATPDSLVIAAASLLLWTMAKLQTTQDGRWWLAAGVAAGTALFAKYTGFFLCGSLVFWLLVSAEGRTWLRTPWPYVGASIALLLFLPTFYWNMTHDFVSFRFQFGRVGAGQVRATHLLDLLGSQIALASPFILVLASVGLAKNAPWTRSPRPLSFAAATIWPALLYFVIHSLHDRVQGNWPCFVYPAAAVLAAQAFEEARDARNGIRRTVRILTLPVAAVILAVAYAQAFFAVLPIGRRDPIARMMGVGIPAVAEQVSDEAARLHAGAIVTTDYAITGWLSFYLPRKLAIIQITDDVRFLSAPQTPFVLLQGTLLYVGQVSDWQMPTVRSDFSQVKFWRRVMRSRNGQPVGQYDLYALSGFHGTEMGRVP
jgi:4-amino-4-deoxy-L-arabinose transferase-like glycosyltransferase